MTKDERLDARHALAYRADYSLRYHRRRASFLEKTDRLLSLVVIVAGTGAFVSLISAGPAILAKGAALAAALITALQVVLNIGTEGARHAEWMRRWDRLANDIRCTANPTLAELKEWEDCRAGIEGECVSELRALAVACENDTRSYMGVTEGVRKIQPFQRLIIHLGTYQTEFPEIEAPESPPARADGD